jgi:hypothetical protein
MIDHVLKPHDFFEQEREIVAEFQGLLGKALNHWYHWDFETGNDACVPAAVVYLSRDGTGVREKVVVYIERAANPLDPVAWWGSNEATAFRAMGICLIEQYIDAGGWQGPTP